MVRRYVELFFLRGLFGCNLSCGRIRTLLTTPLTLIVEVPLIFHFSSSSLTCFWLGYCEWICLCLLGLGLLRIMFTVVKANLRVVLRKCLVL